MKTERRHELKENDLAHAIQVGKDYLNKNSKNVGVALIIVVATLAVALLVARSRAVSREDSWRRRAELDFRADIEIAKQSLASLSTLARESTDEGFVLSALLEHGRQALLIAQRVPSPPDAELNELARGTFLELLDRYPENEFALGVAHSGLATVEENAFVLDGDSSHKEKCREHLTEITENAALNTLPFHRLALDRLELLDATFTKFTFAPPPPLPDPGTPAVLPFSSPTNARPFMIDDDGFKLLPIEPDQEDEKAPAETGDGSSAETSEQPVDPGKLDPTEEPPPPVDDPSDGG